MIVDYTGSHLDGKVFDTNRKVKMTVSELVEGVKEGLQLLRNGAKASFWVPGKLAYRAMGAPQAQIGPMETLVFDFTILEVRHATPEKSQKE